MLTVETLKQNASLAGLTDEQFAAIATMSTNDENQVMGAKIGEIHGGYDKDIFEVTGVAKQSGEKSYAYAKRVLSEMKAKADDQPTQKALAEANSKIKALEQQINSGDDALRKQLLDSQNQVAQLQAQNKEVQAQVAKTKEDYEKQIQNVKIDNAFDKAASGIKFKGSIPQSVHGALLAQAKAEIMSKGTPEFTEKGELVFRGANNQLLMNPNNSMNPYTVAELLADSSLKDVIDNGRQQGGAGTGNGGGQQGGQGGVNTNIDLSACRTRDDAMNAIDAFLMSQGLTVDNAEFHEKRTELYKDNNVDKLPMYVN